MTPPAKLLEFYSGAENRGYLSDPAEVAESKLRLAQKYGFSLSEEQMAGTGNIDKDPRQIFYGLEPGWLVNLSDNCIYKPEDEPVLEQVYKS